MNKRKREREWIENSKKIKKYQWELEMLKKSRFYRLVSNSVYGKDCSKEELKEFRKKWVETLQEASRDGIKLFHVEQ